MGLNNCQKALILKVLILLYSLKKVQLQQATTCYVILICFCIIGVSRNQRLAGFQK